MVNPASLRILATKPRPCLWGGELWEDGYFAGTVGDKVTAEAIRRYIQHHRTEKAGDSQLSLFE
jgi:REP element-mobilizing transposase RayT